MSAFGAPGGDVSGEPVTWRAVILAREAERVALAMAASERARRERAEDALAVLRGRHDALLATDRAVRSDYDRVSAERDRLARIVSGLQMANLRLRLALWGTAPLRWLRPLRRLG